MARAILRLTETRRSLCRIPVVTAPSRGKIIQSARRLFNRHGFDNVSLDQIMSGAGLTRGGFYSYFRSKSDLYAEVLGCFFTDPQWKSCWEGVEVDLASRDVGPQVVRAYLSRQHFEDVENSCPMVALPTDVTRSGESAKHAFETVFGAMVTVLERSLKQGRRSRCTGRRRLLPCVWVEWSSPGHWAIVLTPMNCVTPACLLRWSLGAGTNQPDLHGRTACQTT